MESQIWSHSRWSLCNKVVLGLDQDEDGLVLRYQGCILAISDNFIPKSMPKLSIFSKKRYHFLSKNGQNQGLIFVQFCWEIPELSWHQKSWSLQFLRVFVVVLYQKNFESTHFSLNVEMCRFLKFDKKFFWQNLISFVFYRELQSNFGKIIKIKYNQLSKMAFFIPLDKNVCSQTFFGKKHDRKDL